MARPKADIENKRSFKVTVRFNYKERILIEKAARECGSSVYLVVRHKLLKGKFPEPKMARVDVAQYAELKKIGVNINQLAKHANSGMFPYGIRELLLQLKNQQNMIINLLLNDSQSEDR
jgi:hypothetical protein